MVRQAAFRRAQFRLPRADVDQRLVQTRPPTGRIDHEVGGDVTGVGTYTGDVRRLAATGEQAGDADGRTDLDAGLCVQRAAQDPVERRPARRKHGEAVVAGTGDAVGDRRRQLPLERYLDSARGEKVVVDVWQPMG